MGDSLRPERRLSFFEIYEQVEEMPIEIAPIISRHRVYFTRVVQALYLAWLWWFNPPYSGQIGFAIECARRLRGEIDHAILF